MFQQEGWTTGQASSALQACKWKARLSPRNFPFAGRPQGVRAGELLPVLRPVPQEVDPEAWSEALVWQ